MRSPSIITNEYGRLLPFSSSKYAAAQRDNTPPTEINDTISGAIVKTSSKSAKNG